jgi:hypothetical protein
MSLFSGAGCAGKKQYRQKPHTGKRRARQNAGYQSNFTLKLLQRLREQTPAAEAQALFIRVVMRQSGRLGSIASGVVTQA